MLYKIFKQNKKYNSGFTLIELLVVIAIIGVLSGIVLVSINSARAKSRDGKRLSEIRSLRIALELYRDDNSTVPQDSGWIGSMTPSQNLNSLVSLGYIGKLPSDPNFTGTNNDFYYRNIAGTYICISDNDPKTYCVRFLTESASALGPAGFYCLTSLGVHRAGSRAGESATATDGFTPNCTQL